MSKKANPQLIGLFVVGAVAMLVGAVLLFGSGKLFKDTDLSVTYFEGSVTGLKKGSSVLFRGVPVGSVAEVFATVDRETLDLQVTVVLEVDRTAVRDPSGLPRTESSREIIDALIEKGLRTKLINESLVTGQLAVELDFYPDSPTVFRAPPGSEYPEIPSVPSDLQKIQQVLDGMVSRLEGLEVEELITSAARTLDTIDRLANSEQVARILDGADRLVNSEDSQRLTADLRAAIGELDATLEDSRRLIVKLDGQVGPLIARLDPTVEQLDQTLVETQKTLKSFRALTGEDSELAYRANSALKEMEYAMRSLRDLVEFLERHPEALLRGKKKP